MKRRMVGVLALGLLVSSLLALSFSRPAAAAGAGLDGGQLESAAGDAGQNALDAGSADAAAPSATAPLACGGELCDTTNGSACTFSIRPLATHSPTPTALLLVCAALALAYRRDTQRRRRP
jgi:hypothetical protein